jgi:raffinose/stachyose/melibiose transport system substrate-binding protein
MNSWKRVFVFLALLMIALLVIACAAPAATTEEPAPDNNSSGNDNTPDDDTEEPAATEATSDEPITLTVMTHRVGAQAEVLEQIARDFEQENPNITIDFSAPGADYESLMKIKMAANDMPDVFSTHGWAKIRYGDFLADLRDEAWAGQIDKAIAPVVTDEDGKVYVLPMDQDKGGPVFNADILDQYGIDVPMTWDDLLAACETIKTESDGEVICIHIGGADSWPVGQYYDFFSTPLAISPESNDADALLDGSYDWDKYTVLSENLLALQDLGYLNPDVLTAKYEDSAQAFAEGKVAFGIYGPFLCEEATKINPDLHCGLMPIPAIDPSDEPTLVGGESTTWGAWKDSPHLEAAKKLIAFYAKPEHIAAVANSNKLPAGLSGVEIDAGYLTDYYKQYENLRVFPYFDRVYLPNGMWDVLCKNGQDVLANGITPQEATENIEREFNRLREAE